MCGVRRELLDDDRQTGLQRQLGRLGPSLDHEDEMGPRALRIDDRRRVFCPRRDEGDGGGKIRGTAVAGEAHPRAHSRFYDVRLGQEEAQLDAEVGQQGHHGRAQRHPFADIEKGVLDQRVVGRDRHQVGEPTPGAREVGLALLDQRRGGGDFGVARGKVAGSFLGGERGGPGAQLRHLRHRLVVALAET